MEAQSDFRELLALLNKHAVDCIEDFSTPQRVIQLGTPPVCIDFITSLTGVTWEEAVATRVPGSYGDVPVYFLGRKEFLANKRALGRKKDLADIEALGEE